MRAHGAAPEVSRTSGHGSIDSGDATSLPQAIVERLAGEGVRSLADWRALGRRRFQIFGITRATARTLDALARRSR